MNNDLIDSHNPITTVQKIEEITRTTVKPRELFTGYLMAYPSVQYFLIDDRNQIKTLKY